MFLKTVHYDIIYEIGNETELENAGKTDIEERKEGFRSASYGTDGTSAKIQHHQGENKVRTYTTRYWISRLRCTFQNQTI